MKTNYDVVVIGEGPAGMAATLFLKRANVDLCVIEKSAPGGKLLFTERVENYPGFKSDSGVSLAMIMYQQLKDENVVKYHCEVLDIIQNVDSTFTITTTKDTLTCKNVIFSGGTELKKLGVKGEEEYFGKGVSYCALCDGPFYLDKDVIVIGGGNSAFTEALYLSRICKSVTILARNYYKADEGLIDKAKAEPKIIMKNYQDIKEILGDGDVTGVRVVDKNTGIESIISTNAVFIYVGFNPTSKMLVKYNITDERGYIYVDESRQTKITGLYAAGDCVSKTTRQIVTSVADGVTAAVSILRRL